MGFAENMLKDLDKRQETARQANDKPEVTTPEESRRSPGVSPGPHEESRRSPGVSPGPHEESRRSPGISPGPGPEKDGIYEKEATDVIRMVDICQAFDKADGSKFVLFDHFNFTISDFKGQGQFISIMGASGSGKSQLIKYIAGLTKPQSGKIFMYGKEYDDKTTVPMVFQQPSCYKWKTVLQNVELPLKLQGVDKEEREKKARAMIKLVGLEGQEDKWARYPDLSGGQRQRVALARNLVSNSQILLLDECTSALDILAKRKMQDILLDIYYSSEVDPTIINVTHSIDEAVYLSNRIIILKPNPCQIYKVIDVDFGNIRRTPDIRELPKFNEYVKQAERAMEEIGERLEQ